MKVSSFLSVVLTALDTIFSEESSPERNHGGSSNVDSVPPEHSSPGSEAGSGGSGNQVFSLRSKRFFPKWKRESSPERDHGGSSNVDSVPPEHSSPGSEAGSGGSGNQDVFVVGGTDDRATSFFAQPGILAAVIGGAVVGLLCAILVVMFIVYRMRKKDEGSYALEEPKRSPASNSYMKNSNREFYA
ncbi:syndecan-like [Diaphorina citri]|uniref:Syndecan n=1 Tax=Diaphorina citri TaxID=121845 RepID=A0A1S3CV05_DIACI|nr:syndecan-like [Diaphorina citri]